MYRTSHGNAAGTGPRIETPPPDELSAGIPAGDAGRPIPEAPGERDERGRFRPGARTAQAQGARRANELARGRVKILECLGLVDLPADVSFHPYLIQAEAFAQAEVTRLAAEVGAGHCPINAASIVQTAALQLASSRWLFATAEGNASKLSAASKLGDSSKQNLAMAHELTARTAKARGPERQQSDDEAMAQFFDELAAEPRGRR